MKADRSTRQQHTTEGVPQNAVDPSLADSTSDLGTQDIATLAYALWEERGCPDGCPEDDWYRAEEIIRARK